MSNELEPILIAGSSNPKLAEDVEKALHLPVHRDFTSRFADGEVKAKIGVNVRKRDVFIIQSTCPPNVDGNLIELFTLINAVEQASAGEINVVIPYFGYSRQDKQDRKSRDSINAAWSSKTIKDLGAKRIVTVDLHSAQTAAIPGLPWEHLYASSVLVPRIKKLNLPDLKIVSPDGGGVTRARIYNSELGTSDSIATLYKTRPAPNVSEITVMTGNVEGKDVMLIDDMADTCGTLVNAASYVIEQGGARSVRAAVTHGLFSNGAVEKINASPIQQLFITDTISVRNDVLQSPKIKIVSVANLIAQAIEQIHTAGSVREL